MALESSTQHWKAVRLVCRHFEFYKPNVETTLKVATKHPRFFATTMELATDKTIR
jgi:hypothetical protein